METGTYLAHLHFIPKSFSTQIEFWASLFLLAAIIVVPSVLALRQIVCFKSEKIIREYERWAENAEAR